MWRGKLDSDKYQQESSILQQRKLKSWGADRGFIEASMWAREFSLNVPDSLLSVPSTLTTRARQPSPSTAARFPCAQPSASSGCHLLSVLCSTTASVPCALPSKSSGRLCPVYKAGLISTPGNLLSHSFFKLFAGSAQAGGWAPSQGR